MHPHTWEIVDVFKQSNNFITFRRLKSRLNPYSGKQDKIMNTTPPFDSINPTLENVAIYLQIEAVFWNTAHNVPH